MRVNQKWKSLKLPKIKVIKDLIGFSKTFLINKRLTILKLLSIIKFKTISLILFFLRKQK